jgi:hypothetical protein
LISRKLGIYPHNEFLLKLKPDAKPTFPLQNIFSPTGSLTNIQEGT